MPKQILPDALAFEAFFKKIQEKYSCKKVTYKEIRHWVESIDVQETEQKSSRHQKSGTEVAFSYERANHPIRVIIWTTYVAGNQSAREHDAAWVILIDKRSPDKPIFYSFPIHRTKNFFIRFEKYIAAFIALVNTWPKPCVHCNEEPTIRNVRGGELLQYAFVCPKKHRLPRTWIYQNLPDEHRLFLEKAFRDYAAYRTRNTEQGIVRTPRMVIRSGKNSSGKKGIDYDAGSQINPQTEAFPFSDLQYEGME